MLKTGLAPLETEVLVIGGGSAGVAAARSAALSGHEVILVESKGYLGGTLTATTLGSLCGYFTMNGDQPKLVVGGLATELTDRLAKKGSLGPPTRWLNTASLPYEPAGLAFVLDEWTALPGLRTILGSTLIEVEVGSPGRIDLSTFDFRGSRFGVKADVVIDCTGDATVCHLAGLDYTYDHETSQSATTMMRLGGVEPSIARTISRQDLHGYLQRAVVDGAVLPRTAGGIFVSDDGTAHLNVTKVAGFDLMNAWDYSGAEREGRRQVEAYVDAFRNYVPGFEDSWLLGFSAELGVRESRRIEGRKTLTEEDIIRARKRSDGIASSAWPVEEHTVDGNVEWAWLPDGDFYDIPLGALMPKVSENILVAGRCLSATHRAQASARVVAQCIAMGEAVGIAASSFVSKRLRDVGQISTHDVRSVINYRGGFLGNE